MGFAIFLLALFLVLLAVLALAASRVFLVRDPEGRLQPPGCALAVAACLGLGCLGFLGLACFAAALVVLTIGRAVESSRVDRVWIGMEEGAPPPPELHSFDPSRPLHLVFEVRGGEAAVRGPVELVRDLTDGAARPTVRTEMDEQGRTLTVVDFALPADREDLLEVEQELRRYLPTASWARGVTIEFKGERRDW
ncbi:MAG TPA: hypothetical protein VMS76_17975 [Planctomycetota bacterium]|nr:hypothetical protein [Planctomycetota bacterium]